jgi:CheY-like chemotaxis protein
MRTFTTLLVAMAMLAAASDGLSACGDKFIRIGRQLRYGRYVAMYPASILIYGPSKSAPARIPELPTALKRAGHSTTIVTSAEQLSTALRSGKFDLVLAGLEHAQEAVREARLAPSHPDVVPVLIKPSKADEESAKAVSTCRVNASARHKNDALAEIDHKMELRLERKSPAGADRR